MRRRAVLGIAGAALLTGCTKEEKPEGKWVKQADRNRNRLAGFHFGSKGSSDRTFVYGSNGYVATLTEGARTVLIDGPVRVFSEPDNTHAVVRNTSRVRIAPRAWYTGAQDENWFADWFLAQLKTSDPDILDIAMQYLDGKPLRRDREGVPFAGDAGFGLVRTSDTVDGADFYDYLGIPWTWQDGSVSRPSKRWARKVDCSGYIRLVYGYRGGIENFRTNSLVNGLPRNARSMAKLAPSVLIAKGQEESSGPEVRDLSALLPGDLTFFALHDDRSFISHSGIYIGNDQHGDMRFLSSRTSINGPTFGDFNTMSVFNKGFFKNRLRRVIRL